MALHQQTVSEESNVYIVTNTAAFLFLVSVFFSSNLSLPSLPEFEGQLHGSSRKKDVGDYMAH